MVAPPSSQKADNEAAYDLAIVGGGIVGLATAWTYLQRFPKTRVILFEKEQFLSSHQTGHNSGVLHSGIYYAPGSSKARNCRRGKQLMESFCREHAIPFELCGKVVVATEANQLPALERIRERGVANGVECERIDRARLLELEPHAAGIAALHVQEAGIVDYTKVCEQLAKAVQAAGGQIQLGAKVTSMEIKANASPSTVHIKTSPSSSCPTTDWHAKAVVNCAGLYSDRVLQSAGSKRTDRIVPFRGEYYVLRPEAQHLVKDLIYPVPDPSFPFLGVHFTRRINGSIECGPNAVLAFSREGYTKLRVRPLELADTLLFPGFWKLAGRYWRTGLGEMWRSCSKAAFVRALQALVPEIRSEHLEPAPAGVRAQALAPSGALLDDFVIDQQGPITHVLNAPSPAATSSLAIAETVLESIDPPHA